MTKKKKKMRLYITKIILLLQNRFLGWLQFCQQITEETKKLNNKGGVRLEKGRIFQKRKDESECSCRRRSEQKSDA